MNFRIAVLAGAVAALVLGITLATQPQTPGAPPEPRVAEQPGAPSQHRLEIGPTAETNGNVYEYH